MTLFTRLFLSVVAIVLIYALAQLAQQQLKHYQSQLFLESQKEVNEMKEQIDALQT
jgi:hypothetical protein